jgi:hypothetical protein
MPSSATSNDASSPLTEHHLDGLRPGRLGDGLAAGGRAESFGNQAAKKPFIPNDVGQTQGLCAGRRILAVAAEGKKAESPAEAADARPGRGVERLAEAAGWCCGASAGLL